MVFSLIIDIYEGKSNIDMEILEEAKFMIEHDFQMIKPWKSYDILFLMVCASTVY